MQLTKPRFRGRRLQAEVEIDLAPLVREELEAKLMTTKVDRSLLPQVIKVIKTNGKVKVPDEVAKYILGQLLDSIHTITKDRWLSKEPAMKYHLGALEHAVKDFPPILATLSILVASAASRVRRGLASDTEEVSSLLAATVYAIKAKGCPQKGCVVKREGKWRVVSNRTGKLWPQTYDTKQGAEGALAAYHLRRQGVPPR